MSEPPRGHKYFISEIERAKRIAEEWTPAVLDMSLIEICSWVQSGAPVQLAIDLHRRGGSADDVQWRHRDDEDRVTLLQRLVNGVMSLDQVVLEGLDRRTRS